MIVSEEGIRKIVQKKLEEGGFDQRSRIELGRQPDSYCDLSNIDDTELAVFFAKNFLYNAKGVTRKGLLDSMKNMGRFGRTAQEDAEFEDAVRKSLSRQNRENLKKYRIALEIGISTLLGPSLAKIFCTFLNELIGPGNQKVADVSTQALVVDAASIEYAWAESANQFFLENKELAVFNSKDQKIIFIFPKTSILLATGETEKAKEKYASELQIMSDIIQKPNQNVTRILERIEDYFYGISRKRIVLKSFKNYLQSLDNNYENGDEVRKYLASIFDQSNQFFSYRF